MKAVSKFIYCSLMVMITLIVSSIFSHTPAENEYKQHIKYYELVSVCEQDAEQCIEPINRDGISNYKGLECE